ncbi:hypothetical protein ACFL0T_01250, partial [Candidatus Omnitrophota bacterium]
MRITLDKTQRLLIFEKLLSLFLVALFCSTTMAMSASVESNDVDSQTGATPQINYQVEGLLNRLKSAYQAKKYFDFVDILDMEFPDLTTFKGEIQQVFNKKKGLEVEFVVDSVLTDNN